MSAFRATSKALQEQFTSGHWHHLAEAKTPFWKRAQKYLRINPEISSGIPLTEHYRNPPPGSRPEHHSIPPSKASDPAGNLYHNRDFRRQYPKLEMITQQDLTKLLLAQPNEDGTKSIPAPGSEQAKSTALVAPEDISSPAAFTEVLAQVHKTEAYSKSNLPPTPPFRKAHHILKLQKGAVPHDPHAYYPAENYA